MARPNNAAYWSQRMKLMEDALKDHSFSYVENMERQFAAAQAEVEREIAVWYQRFAANNEITLADAKRLLTSGELEEFRWAVGEYIAYGQQNALDGAWMKQLENASARVHISRLEAIKLQIQQQAERLYANQLDLVDAAVRETYLGSYYGTAFEIQRGLGVGWIMPAINERAIEKVLSRPWTADNLTFRDRCWTNKQDLVNSVNTQLTQMIIRGEAPDETIKAISHQFDVSRAKAGRLIMTESAAFSSAAQKDCYSELGVERYTWICSFDKDTCQLCGSMDGQVFKLSDYQVGVTAPPGHPWCRCCTCPYFEDMTGERWAKDAVTGETFKVPGDMTYEQWKAQQDAKWGEGTVDLQRKMSYNETADRVQFQKYKEALGNLAPKSFEEFQQIKYRDPEKWGTIKGQYRILSSYKIDSGSMTPAEILRLDDRVITEKRTMFTSKYKNRGNIAGAYLDGDTEKMFFAHSALSDTAKGYKGSGELVLLKDEDTLHFQYIKVPGKDGLLRPRTWNDTEAKLFEYFADLYEKRPFTSITMLSERGMCDSCKGVVAQFRALHPNIQINVVSNKSVLGDVWKYRRHGRN